MSLGFGHCQLAVQAPITDNVKSVSAPPTTPEPWKGSPKEITRKFFAQYETAETGPTKIKFVSGSVEAACGLGLADGIVDLVETGTTMRAAGLEIVEKIMDTQAVVIKNPSAEHPTMVSKFKSRIEGYHTATQFQLIQYNVRKEDIAACLKLTPGKRSPTISSLDQTGYMAVSALVKKADAATIMDGLAEAGADSVLIFNIANSRM
ncbi:ATP phosphoribosyltransferase-domain-containing protein [Baffinella frigidus]|nr:ATP phosphoribosyltransferase-domain-containing protein [Cryptophyta sp. CCMP2293]